MGEIGKSNVMLSVAKHLYRSVQRGASPPGPLSEKERGSQTTVRLGLKLELVHPLLFGEGAGG